MPNTKLAHTTSTSQLIEQVVAKYMQKEQQKIAAASNMENAQQGQYVTNKLRHTGDGYTDTSATSYILQQRRDLISQPNQGPLVEKPSSDLPNNLDSLGNDIHEPLYETLDPGPEPTGNGTSEQPPQGPDASEKLQLKKDAAAVLYSLDQVREQGQKIIDYMMAATIGKTGSYNITNNEVINQTALAATQDGNSGAVKSAMLSLVDDAIYAAEGTAVKIADALAGEQLAQESFAPEALLPEESDYPAEAPIQSIETEGGSEITEADVAAFEQALEDAGVTPEEVEAVLSGVDVDPTSDPSMAGSAEISEDDLAEFEQAMAEAGVTPDEVEEALAEIDGAGGGEVPPIEDADAEADAFTDELAQAGISPEETQEAFSDVAQEEALGIPPEAAAAADEEAAKTGHYKFASFINRPNSKTAQQEQRAAIIRTAVRDFIYGPQTSNFN
jgi:hypothetical protein